MNRTGLLSLLAVSTAMTVLAGCSKDPPPPQQPQAYQGQYPQQPGAYPQPAPGPQPGQQPGQQPAQPGGLQIPGMPGQAPAGPAGGSAQAIDPNLAQLAVAPLTMFANTGAWHGEGRPDARG